ncbi:unnamed protein product [Rhizoctonia solani]|uniref:Uncharacterized protein n=1 Tax=Rhizoctonia solani TaxID=456999 RepID=A0A8H3C2C6_9AGAM|nr:unnamed protein product [Rhizoctonia solani]
MGIDVQRSHPLTMSLAGVPSPRAFIISNDYRSTSWPGCESRVSDMTITGVEDDLNCMLDWASHFMMQTKVYHDKIGDLRPTARNLRKILGTKRTLPTFIYISGHGSTINGENAYLPIDCIKWNQFATDKVISESEMRTLLMAQPNPAPLVSCASSNFLGLPYVFRLEGVDPIWEDTEYLETNQKSPNPIISFYNVSPDEKLSLYGIMERLKLNVGQMRNDHDSGNGSYLHQQYKIYCSHKFDYDHFFEALGFKLATGETCWDETPL